MKEIRRVIKVKSQGDVVHIETIKGDRETFTNVENISLQGTIDTHTSNGVTESTFKRAKCVIVETEGGKKVINCHSSKFEMDKDEKDEG